MLLGRPVRCTSAMTSRRTLLRCTMCMILCRRTMCSTTTLSTPRSPNRNTRRCRCPWACHSNTTRTAPDQTDFRTSPYQWNHENTRNHEVSMGCVGRRPRPSPLNTSLVLPYTFLPLTCLQADTICVRTQTFY